MEDENGGGGLKVRSESGGAMRPSFIGLVGMSKEVRKEAISSALVVFVLSETGEVDPVAYKKTGTEGE